MPCENASTPVPMLYQSDYLTIDYYNKEDDVYALHFPNYEVCQGMVYSFLALRHHHPQGMDGEEEKGSVKKNGSSEIWSDGWGLLNEGNALRGQMQCFAWADAKLCVGGCNALRRRLQSFA